MWMFYQGFQLSYSLPSSNVKCFILASPSCLKVLHSVHNPSQFFHQELSHSSRNHDTVFSSAWTPGNLILKPVHSEYLIQSSTPAAEFLSILDILLRVHFQSPTYTRSWRCHLPRTPYPSPLLLFLAGPLIVELLIHWLGSSAKLANSFHIHNWVPSESDQLRF